MKFADITNRSKKQSLGRLFDEASKAMGFEHRYAPGFDMPTAVIEVPAVAGGWIQMDDQFIPAKKAHPGVSFGGSVGDTESRLDGFLLKNSRVAQAGASVIVVNSQPPVGMTGGTDELAMYSRPTNFRVINPAQFTYLADADPSILTPMGQSYLHEGAYPVADAELRMLDAPSHGFRLTMTRKQQSMFAPELMEYELAKSIALGLANQADATLLKVLANATDDQPTFSIGDAAAKHLAFDDLRALVGTAGTGAAVSQDGVLRVSGIDAELTSAIPGTIVGAFNRAAVAISDEVNILVRRATADGDLEISVFCQIRALVPDSGFFWTVA